MRHAFTYTNTRIKSPSHFNGKLFRMNFVKTTALRIWSIRDTVCIYTCYIPKSMEQIYAYNLVLLEKIISVKVASNSNSTQTHSLSLVSMTTQYHTRHFLLHQQNHSFSHALDKYFRQWMKGLALIWNECWPTTITISYSSDNTSACYSIFHAHFIMLFIW